MPPFRTILVAADFSESSRDAFRVACTLAGAGEARLIVLHVADQALPDGLLGRMIPRTEGDSAYLQALGEQLRKDYSPDGPIDVEFRVRDGLAVEEIIRTVEEVGADLIVLGSHGRSGLGRLLMGSVAEALLRRAPCPTLVLKPGPPEAARIPESGRSESEPSTGSFAPSLRPGPTRP
jgi:nucleotide-binding universal stress UspA family protein